MLGRIAGDKKRHCSSLTKDVGRQREEFPRAWGGEPELQAIAMLHRVTVVAYVKKPSSLSCQTASFQRIAYGDFTDNVVRVLYNGKTHYDAFYLVDEAEVQAERSDLVRAFTRAHLERFGNNLWVQNTFFQPHELEELSEALVEEKLLLEEDFLRDLEAFSLEGDVRQDCDTPAAHGCTTFLHVLGDDWPELSATPPRFPSPLSANNVDTLAAAKAAKAAKATEKAAAKAAAKGKALAEAKAADEAKAAVEAANAAVEAAAVAEAKANAEATTAAEATVAAEAKTAAKAKAAAEAKASLRKLKRADAPRKRTAAAAIATRVAEAKAASALARVAKRIAALVCGDAVKAAANEAHTQAHQLAATAWAEGKQAKADAIERRADRIFRRQQRERRATAAQRAVDAKQERRMATRERSQLCPSPALSAEGPVQVSEAAYDAMRVGVAHSVVKPAGSPPAFGATVRSPACAVHAWGRPGGQRR